MESMAWVQDWFSWLLRAHSLWCVLSCSVVSDFATPRTVARRAPLSMGFSRQEHWSGLPCPPPRDLPDPRIEATSPTSPALAGGFCTPSATWGGQVSHGLQVRCQPGHSHLEAPLGQADLLPAWLAHPTQDEGGLRRSLATLLTFAWEGCVSTGTLGCLLSCFPQNQCSQREQGRPRCLLRIQKSLRCFPNVLLLAESH